MLAERAGEGRRRRLTVGPALRAAIVTAVLAIGLAAAGGFGYAMNLSGGFVVKVSRSYLHIVSKPVKKVITATKTIPTTKVVAADDQYGTTTTTATTTTSGGGGSSTTITTTTTVATTTTGSTSTTASGGAPAQVTVIPGGSTSVSVSGSSAGAPAATVNVAPTTFSTPVTLAVNPAPGVASFGGASTTPAVQALTTAPPGSSTYMSVSASTVSGGQSVTSLTAPLEIDFTGVSSDWQPFYVNGGGGFRTSAGLRFSAVQGTATTAPARPS